MKLIENDAKFPRQLDRNNSYTHACLYVNTNNILQESVKKQDIYTDM